MSKFIQKLKTIATDPNIRKRVLFILGALVVFRILAVIPVPGIDTAQLSQFFAQNQFLGLLNIFSGGGLSNLSIVMLGVAPYITSSIIMQLSTIMSERMKALYHEEGEAGRRKFTQYSRMLTVPLAVVQGIGLITLFQQQGIIAQPSLFDFITNIVVITAGSILLMWIGELISEFGIGNGVSIIIFAGIVASLPQTVAQLAFSFDITQLPIYLGFGLAAIAIVAGVVAVAEAERPVPITYAKQVRGDKTQGGVSTYLPLRLNQTGVIPIIFALSILLLPQMLANLLGGMDNQIVQSVANAMLSFADNGVLYSTFYFLLVFGFTYFYTAVTFDPDTIANNLQKSGAFVPGVRPGQHTSDYIARILTRITFVGALFLGTVAVLPLIMQSITGITAFAIGGTALLIAVTVVLDLVKKIDAQISMREY